MQHPARTQVLIFLSRQPPAGSLEAVNILHTLSFFFVILQQQFPTLGESPSFFCVSEDRCNAASLADTYMFTYSSLKQISNIYTGYTIEYYMTLRTGVTKTTSPFFIAQSAFLIQFLFSF